eukprot:TRINITY_DN3039_c0_g1_i1.p1 TRINITY_DN3039_c0_g1~~TRINITY_DN3039_c0_g1_i1.p1  ORF type:complete len:485 (-),score=133.69 TRINITY_DN3039_c0_g1_i1:1123-2577(-)
MIRSRNSILPNVFVDQFDLAHSKSKEKRIFFLTHFHADHFVGLNDEFDEKIYCSELTRMFVQNKFKSIGSNQFEILNEDQNHFFELNGRMIRVKCFPTNHCPGSLMILLEGEFGRILHSGDLRYIPYDFNHIIPHLRDIKLLYLDTTFLDPKWDSFPTQKESIEQVINLIRDQWNDKKAQVYIEGEMIGTESLLERISIEFKTKIHVRPSFYRKLSIIYGSRANKLFTTEESESQFHACKAQSFLLLARNQRQALKNGVIDHLHPLLIKASTQWFGMDGRNPKTFSNEPVQFYGIWHVLFSIHSSFSELKEFVNEVNPKQIITLTECDKRIVSSLLNQSHKPKERVIFSQMRSWKCEDPLIKKEQSNQLWSNDDNCGEDSIDDLLEIELKKSNNLSKSNDAVEIEDNHPASTSLSPEESESEDEFFRFRISSASKRAKIERASNEQKDLLCIERKKSNSARSSILDILPSSTLSASIANEKKPN